MNDNPSDWLEADLQALIESEVTESLTLEFKAHEALTRRNNDPKREISKVVSSFANSAGGTVVYGVVEVGHLATQMVGMDPRDVTREWLQQVIHSGVQPRVDGLVIN
jgi:predicted HTH transcriptional regulator